jgi:HAD superfamily hydrolase (TIGR01484 family)
MITGALMHNNRRQKPIFCFDFDGTLLNENEQIHSEDLHYLKEEIDFIPVAATGRTLDSVKRVLAKNGLFKNQKIPFPMILMNGSAVFGFNQEIVKYTPFKPLIQSQVMEQLTIETEVAFLLMGLEKNYLFSPTSFGISACKRYDFDFEEIGFIDSVVIPISKVMCYSENPDALAAMKDRYAHFEVEGAFSMPTIFELTPPGINKGKGYQLLMDGLHLDPILTVAVGDGGNDLPLLAQVELTFAPDHAPEEVKNRAQFHIHRESNGIFAPILNQVVPILNQRKRI